MINSVCASNNYMQIFDQTLQLERLVGILFSNDQQIKQSAVKNLMQFGDQDFISEVFTTVVHIDSQSIDARLDITLMLLDELSLTAHLNPGFKNLIKVIMREIKAAICDDPENFKSNLLKLFEGIKNIVFKYSNREVFLFLSDAVAGMLSGVVIKSLIIESKEIATNLFILCHKTIIQKFLNVVIDLLPDLNVATIKKFFIIANPVVVNYRAILSCLLIAHDNGAIDAKKIVEIFDWCVAHSGFTIENKISIFAFTKIWGFSMMSKNLSKSYISDHEFLSRVIEIYGNVNKNFIQNLSSMFLLEFSSYENNSAKRVSYNIIFSIIQMLSMPYRNEILNNLVSFHAKSPLTGVLVFSLGDNITIDSYLLMQKNLLTADKFFAFLTSVFNILNQFIQFDETINIDINFSQWSLNSLSIISPYLVVYTCRNKSDRLLELYNNHPAIADVINLFYIEDSFIVPVQDNEYLIFSSLFKPVFAEHKINKQQKNEILSSPVYISSNNNMTSIANNSNIIPQLLLEKISALRVAILPVVGRLMSKLNELVDNNHKLSYEQMSIMCEYASTNLNDHPYYPLDFRDQLFMSGENAIKISEWAESLISLDEQLINQLYEIFGVDQNDNINKGKLLYILAIMFTRLSSKDCLGSNNNSVIGFRQFAKFLLDKSLALIDPQALNIYEYTIPVSTKLQGNSRALLTDSCTQLIGNSLVKIFYGIRSVLSNGGYTQVAHPELALFTNTTDIFGLFLYITDHF